MIPNGIDFESLAQRVGALEQQNRTLKKFLLLGLLSLGAVIFMGQATTGKHVIEANEFRVIDASGKTVATLGGPEDYGLIVYDALGRPAATLDASGLLISDLGSREMSVAIVAGDWMGAVLSRAWLTSKLSPQGKLATFSTTGMTLNDDVSGGEATVSLEAGANGNRLRISDKEGTVNLEAGGNANGLRISDKENIVSLEAGGNANRLSIIDKDGFSSVIGNADLETERTGETHRTSAASLVLFDKNGKVIWRAP